MPEFNPPTYLKLLKEQGYLIDDRNGYFVIRKKIIKSIGVLLIFLFLSIPLLFVGAFMVSEEELLGVGLFLLVLGVLLGQVPFFSYLTAPYKSLLFQYDDESLLFRSRFSRAYKLSEFKELVISFKQHQSDANPFSDTSLETTYNIDMVFSQNHREELFKIVGRSELNHNMIRELADYFEMEVFTRKL